MTLNVAKDSVGDVIRCISWKTWGSWSTWRTWRARNTCTLTVGRCWCPGGSGGPRGSWRSRQVLPYTITLK